MNSDCPQISIVIPVYNEEEILPKLYERLTATMEQMGRTYEFILVDDGSLDRSFEVLRSLREKDKRVRAMQLARNFGQTAALYAGFHMVRGKIVVTLDADLQNPPEEIPKLVEKLDEGYEVVSGWRMNRQDAFHRKMVSRVLNVFIGRLTRTNLHDCGCSLKAFRREFVDRLILFEHRSRYLPADIGWLTRNIAEIPVDHEERRTGSTKYTLPVLIRTGFDLVTSITATPLQLIAFAGWLFSLIGFVMAIGIGAVFFVGGAPSEAVIIAALLFFFTGVQLAALGFICEYINRIYLEVQRKPYYIVKQELP